MSGKHRLIVNADDFGFTRDVNAGIVEAHRHGILTATTLMANGDAFDDAVRLARENPTLDIGCHWCWCRAAACSIPAGNCPRACTAPRCGRCCGGELPVYEELAAQVRKIIAAGIHPSHLDTHKHTHLLPPVLDAVARVAQEFGIPWVRRPFDFGIDAQVRARQNAASLWACV